MKFLGSVGNDTRNRRLDSGDLDHRLDAGIFLMPFSSGQTGSENENRLTGL